METQKGIKESVTPAIVTDGREACSKFWIAVYTRPRSEKKASSELSKLGLDIYLPIQKQLSAWSDRKKMVDVPVIPMILFAKIKIEYLIKIKTHPLIINCISDSNKTGPAHIPSDQIEALKYILGQSEIPVSFEQGIFKSNDKVKILRGSLKGLIGQVKAVKEDMTEVWMSIDLLGGAVMRIKSSELEHLKGESKIE